MRIIGLGHYSRVGKDTLADQIVAECKKRRPDVVTVKVAFAHKLKVLCHSMFAWAGLREPEYYDTIEGAADRDVVLNSIGMTPVQLWVKFGNLMRDEFHADVWVNSLFDDLEGRADVAIVTDVRFLNECDAIREFPGHRLVKVVKPGVKPRDTPSDKALIDYDGWDETVDNCGTVQDLSAHARRLAGQVLAGMPIMA
jgi:hypothetical protein